jgi:hypothetical protein
MNMMKFAKSTEHNMDQGRTSNRHLNMIVGASPHLVDDSGLKVNKHSTGDVLPSASLTEEGVESIITSPMVLSPGIWPSA